MPLAQAQDVAAHAPVLRWGVLALSCLLMVGNYYCYDNPAALKSQLQQHFDQLSRADFEWRFNLLYTLYSVPNMVLPFLGGAFVDRHGTSTTLIAFSGAILVGQVLFATGSSLASFDLMLVGRFVVGLGGECLQVAQGTLVTEWFKHEELAFAMGLNLSIARLGSVINNELSPLIAEATDVSTALWAGVFMCILSGISVFLVIRIDTHAKQQLPPSALNAETAAAQSVKLSDAKEFRLSFWLLTLSAMVIYGCVVPFNSVASSLLLERDYFKTPPSDCNRCGEGVYGGQANCEVIASQQCPSSPPFAWPLPRLATDCSITVPSDQWACFEASETSSSLIDKDKINCDNDAWKNGPFTQLYCAKKAEAEARAATPMSIPYLISATISPFLGLLVDQIGLRALFLLLASVALVVAHSALAMTSMTPVVPLALLGVAYSVYAAVLWPASPLVVEEHHIGTAYGVITAAMNTGLAIWPLVVATVYEHSRLYVPSVELFFVGLALLGCIIGVWVNVLDWQQDWVLNRPSPLPKQHVQLQETGSAGEPSELTPLLV